MNIDLIRTVMTVVMFAVFVGIVVWAWSGKRKARFDRAARSVLDDDDEMAVASGRPTGTRGA